MDENKELNNESWQRGEESPEAHCDGARAASDTEPSVLEEVCSPDTAQAGEESAKEQDALSWSFGEGEDAPQPKHRKTGVFFAVFGGVVGLCFLLLIGLLFLGENGIDVIKTLYNERLIFVREDDGTSGLLTPQEAADLVRRSTVTVSVKTALGTGIGSGFVYDDNGHICTNYHVIENATAVQVILPDGSARDASIVGYEPHADLAVLKVDADGLVPAELGVSGELLAGDAVVAVGTPVDLSLAGTATFGSISDTRRLLPITDTSGSVTKKLTVIQTDVSLNHGNSGGPMADMYGRVIGIVARKMESSVYTYEGLGFAIPIDGAKVILDAIIEDGEFKGENPVAQGRSLLGLTGHGGQAGMWYLHNSLTGQVTASEEEIAGGHYMPANGVYVLEVSGSNVKGKVYEGDIIVEINGLTMSTIQDVIGAVNRHYAGEKITLTLLRDGGTVEVEVRLNEETLS